MARRSKGDGSLYRRERDGKWVGTVELGVSPTGVRRRKTVVAATQAGALEKLRKVRRDVEVHGSVPTTSPTVAQWLDRWMVEIVAPKAKPKTVDGYRHKVALIDESIGRIRLDKLTPAHVRTMHRHAATGRSSTTALHCHRVLRKALQDAMREGLTLRNVCDLVDAPSRAVVDQAALTAAEARTLLRHVADDPLAARWALALLYGVRQGEALGLTWDAVDFTAGTIDLEWQLQRLTWRHGCDPGKPCRKKRGVDCPRADLGIPAGLEVRHLTGAWVLTRPKRGKRRRVPMIPVMAALLHARLAVAPASPYGLVFTDDRGMPLYYNLDNAAWHEHLAAAGLPDVRLHDARHTTATLLLEAGVDAHVIAAILGHSDVVTTRGYQSVDLELTRRALEGLGDAIA